MAVQFTYGWPWKFKIGKLFGILIVVTKKGYQKAFFLLLHNLKKKLSIPPIASRRKKLLLKYWSWEISIQVLWKCNQMAYSLCKRKNLKCFLCSFRHTNNLISVEKKTALINHVCVSRLSLTVIKQVAKQLQKRQAIKYLTIFVGKEKSFTTDRWIELIIECEKQYVVTNEANSITFLFVFKMK